MMSAAHALIEMPTECGRTTARNGQQYLDVLPTNPLAISLDEGSSSSADEIGNLERRRGHWGTSSSNVTHTYIKTAGRSLLRSSCVASAAGRLRPNTLERESFDSVQNFLVYDQPGVYTNSPASDSHELSPRQLTPHYGPYGQRICRRKP